MATANLFVDWGAPHVPAWQVNNGLPIVAGATTAFGLFSVSGVTPPLTVTTQGSGAGLYVTAIDGVVQDPGTGFYWVYFVNGNMPTVGCDAYLLQDGDSIAWDYKHFSSGLSQPNHPGLEEQ